MLSKLLMVMILMTFSDSADFQDCGTDQYCSQLLLFPSGEATSTTITIQHLESNLIETQSALADATYNVTISTGNGVPCIAPSFTFEYEQIDTKGSSEWVSIYDNSNKLIKQCQGHGGDDTVCDKFWTCVDDISLEIDSIEPSTSYMLRIVNSYKNDALCPNDFTINAKLTINCQPAPVADIKVTSCAGWDYASFTNSLQMKLISPTRSTSYFYVNREALLPTNEQSIVFNDVPVSMFVSDLYSIQMAVDDEYGYCISGLTITTPPGVSEEFGSSYFGSGVILASKCDYSFQSIQTNSPLISCIAGAFDLFVGNPRGIYQLGLHTCIGAGNGITAVNMREEVYALITGKKEGQQSYTTTALSYLDHYVPSKLNMLNLGDRMASNVLLTRTPADSTSVYNPSLSGRLIGFKLEIVDSTPHQFDASSAPPNIFVDGEAKVVKQTRTASFGNGKYLLLFFPEGVIDLSGGERINMYGTDTIIGDVTNGVSINIFGIFMGKEEEYSLPFIIEGIYNDSDIKYNWHEAKAQCESKYGTSLTSIHSFDVDFVISGLMLGLGWIGISDTANQGQYVWSDQSFADYTNFKEGGDSQGCGTTTISDESGKWENFNCDQEYNYYVCLSPNWSPNEQRSFEINVPEKIDDLTLVTIGNDNINDNFCLDSVIVNDEPATYLSANKIGGDTGSSTLTAIFKYPVCKTEVTRMRLDEESGVRTSQKDEQLAGMECKNANRMISSTCSISQAFEKSRSTSIAITNESSETKEFSWGDSTAVTTGVSTSKSTTNELSISKELDIPIIGGVDTGYTRTWENGREDTKETTEESFEENTDASSTTNSEEQAWESSDTTSVECAGEIEVPPSHSVQYSLIFNTINTTIDTYSDLKLTLCSAFINPTIADDTSNYIYLKGIKGTVTHKETTTCEVQFNPAEYITNNMTCEEEQRLAFASGSNYIPKCRTNDPKLYDGCQCDIGDSWTLAQCMCVDQNGDMLPNKLMYVEGDDDWKRICTQELECSNSEVVYNPEPIPSECAEKQALAIEAKDTYIPRCQSADNTKYDGCQCTVGDKSATNQCRCVDEVTGDTITNRFLYFDDDDQWERICTQELACSDTEVVYTGNAMPDHELHHDVPEAPSNGLFDMLTVFEIVLCGCAIAALLLYMSKSINTNSDYKKLPKEEEYDEERVPMKEDMA